MTIELNQQTVLQTAEAKNGKRGFTLTEIAIVLGIIGLILGSIWVAAAAVYTNLRSTKATTELLTIVQNIRAMYATSTFVDTGSDMSGFGVQTGGGLTYLQAKVFPGDMISAAGTTASDPWNGNVQITSAKNSVNQDSFAIAFDNVPDNACTTIVTSSTGTGRDPGLVGVTVATKGTAVLTGGSTSAATVTLPVTASVASGLCSHTTDSLAFFFKLK